MNLLTRRRDTELTPAVNHTFAAYTQSAAFSFTLGKTHITGLAHLVAGDELWTAASQALQIPAVRGLERRGLIVHHRGVNTDGTTLTGEVIELTRAGKLMVLLLIESGHLHPALAERVTL